MKSEEWHNSEKLKVERVLVVCGKCAKLVERSHVCDITVSEVSVWLKKIC